MNILVLNSGSSNLKFQIIVTDLDRMQREDDLRLLRGEVEGIGGDATVTTRKGDGQQQKITASLKDISAALDFVVKQAISNQSENPQIRSKTDIHAVGHRVVHGGERFSRS